MLYHMAIFIFDYILDCSYTVKPHLNEYKYFRRIRNIICINDINTNYMLANLNVKDVVPRSGFTIYSQYGNFISDSDIRKLYHNKYLKKNSSWPG